MKNPACAVLEEYEDVPETVSLDFMEDDVMWVASKISGAAGTLGAELIDLRNWLLRFGCASKELRVVGARLAEGSGQRDKDRSGSRRGGSGGRGTGRRCSRTFPPKR